MSRKLNRDQQLVVQEAISELFRGNRVTISCKKFGHSRKFDKECDLCSSPYLLKRR